MMRAERESQAAGASTVKVASAVADAKLFNRGEKVIPGMAPAESKESASAKNKKRKEAAKKKKAEEDSLRAELEGNLAGAPAAAAPEAAAAPAAAPAADDPEKRMKKISKALKQIDELKKKQADGAKLDADQQAKIAKESALREEMKEVEAILKP